MQNNWGSKRNLSGGVEVVRNKHPHKLPMLHEEYSLYREHIGSYRILTAQAFDPPTLLPEVPPTDKPAQVWSNDLGRECEVANTRKHT